MRFLQSLVYFSASTDALREVETAFASSSFFGAPSQKSAKILKVHGTKFAGNERKSSFLRNVQIVNIKLIAISAQLFLMRKPANSTAYPNMSAKKQKRIQNLRSKFCKCKLHMASFGAQKCTEKM